MQILFCSTISNSIGEKEEIQKLAKEHPRSIRPNFSILKKQFGTGGWILAGHEVPTKDALSLPSSTGL